MMMEYKPGILRPQLIRLRDSLGPGITFFQKAGEEVNEHQSRGFLGLFSKKVEKVDTITYSIMSHAMLQRIDSMITVCDMAVENGCPIFVDSDDLMFIEQLKKLDSMITSSQAKIKEAYERA